MSSSFQSIFDAALSDYAKQTEIDLATHPFAQTLQNCDTADAILDLLQDNAKQFRAYRDGNRKLIDCLKPVVQVLHAFSPILAEATAPVPFQPAKAIVLGVDVLLTTSIGVSASYDALIDLFECVGNFLNRLRIYAEIPFSPSMTDVIVKIMVEVLSMLSLATKQIRQGRFKKFARKLLREGEIEAVLQRLDRLTADEARMTGTQTLQVVHSLLSDMKLFMDDGKTSTHGLQQALVTLQETANEINKIKRDQLQEKVRNWLTPPDPSKNHNIARGAHHGGTAEWFIQSNTLEEWEEKGSVLWVHGKPGSGKSILCSTIIQEVKKKCDRGLALMGYYYFDFKDVAKQGIRGLLTSILAQLCAKSDRCYQILSNLYSENNAGSQQPENHALIDCLKEMLRLPQQPITYIIVDALDECPNTSGFPTEREEVLDFLEDLVGLSLPNLRICVTSRPEIDIRTILEPLTSLHVSLHDEGGQKQDILDYIRTVVHSDRRMRRWRLEDKQLVIDILSRKADGMFRWVFCQLETLRRCFPTMIRHALDELPETLDETYERTLLGIEKEKREFAHRLFQCLTVAVRPLQIDELAEVLAIRFDGGKLPRYHVDWRSEDGQEAVLSACSSLIAVVNIDGSSVVQFSHFSVKEFLTSDRLANSTENLSRYHVLPHSAHTILAQASLSVLLHFDDHVDKRTIEDFPFARYAAQHWVDHGQFKDVSSSLEDAMERLFDPDQPSFATWIWIYDIDHPFRQHMFEAHPAPPEVAPLYYAILCGFCGLVEYLIAAHPGDVHARGGYHGTPVNAALNKGNVEIALLLLEHGADLDIMDARNMTPLYRASESGRCDIVEFLLEHHADVDARNRYSETALMVTAREGQPEVARILLRHGASVDALDDKGWTPLQAASRYGHLDIVQFLIQSGAAVETRDDHSWTPLMDASYSGRLDIVQLLIENGAVVGAQNVNGSTSLKEASISGHSDIVRLLVQSGATLDLRDGEGRTALGTASLNGHPDIVQLLIQSGAAVDSHDDGGETALMFASQYGHLDVARELLDHGATVNAQSTEHWTPLHFASGNGYLSIVELLIERQADVNKRNKNQQTPLDRATRYGEFEIARVLVKSGSSAISQDSNGSTPLHIAAHNGRFDIVKLLLESGADVNVRDGNDMIPLDLASVGGNRQVTRYLAEHMGVLDPSDGMDTEETPENLGLNVTLPPDGVQRANSPGSTDETSLLTASAEGKLDLVRSLLDNGADVHGRDVYHRTALYLAAENGEFEVVKLLIKYGTDVNCRMKDGWTALHAASRFGYPEIAQLLLDHSADVNVKEQDHLTPLHLASWNGCVEVVKLLLERGADVYGRDIEGRTPSLLALGRGERDIVRLLSGHISGGG